MREADASTPVPGAWTAERRSELTLVAAHLVEAALRRLDLEAAAARAEREALVAALTPAARRAEPAPGRAVDLEIDLDVALGPGVASDDDVFDRFWAEVLEEHPVRHRLRRWTGRVAP